ncbi:hypothetical protein ACJMK2_028288, partial [Sinanodonta woodiana]
AGPVRFFQVDKGFGEDEYITAVVYWQPPFLEEQNGPITIFYVEMTEINNPSNFK